MKSMFGVLIVLSLISLNCTPKESSEPASKEAHENHGDGHQTLQLNNGKKWPTDEALRVQMAQIHGLLDGQSKKIQSDGMSPTEFQSLGQSIQKSIDTIFKECKLPPSADQQLHIVLSGIWKENSILKKGSDPVKMKGSALEILKQHELYLKYFDAQGNQAP